MGGGSRADMTDDIPLAEAPDHFFDPERWREFVAEFAGDRDQALTALAAIFGEPGIHAFYRAAAVKAGDARAARDERRAQLGKALVAEFLAALRKGSLVATALAPPLLVRAPVPGELWSELKPDFAAGSAVWGIAVLTQIRIAKAEGARGPTLAARCVEFLRRRRAAGESRKKILAHEARAELGDALTSRDFDAAYREVFARKRGRPRRDA